jgi:hypothetical protein
MTNKFKFSSVFKPLWCTLLVQGSSVGFQRLFRWFPQQDLGTRSLRGHPEQCSILMTITCVPERVMFLPNAVK